MHEYLESLIEAWEQRIRAHEGPAAQTEPRHRRPRRARTTYVPVRRDAAGTRYAH